MSQVASMPMTGVYQFPQNLCVCAECGTHCYVEQKAFPCTTAPLYVVASHPTHPTCPFSHRVFAVPVIKCEELPEEFFSKEIA